jgi:hypothetical protein
MNELIISKIKKEIEGSVSQARKMTGPKRALEARVKVLKEILLLAESSVSLDFVLDSKNKLMERQSKIISAAENYANSLAFLNDNEKGIAKEKFIKNTDFSQISTNIKHIDLLLSFNQQNY